MEEYKLKYKPSDIVIYIKNKEEILKEVSLVAIDTKSNKVMGLGKEIEDAKLKGQIPEDIVTLSPLKNGFIAEFTIALQMFKYFIQKVNGHNIFKRPKVVVCTPPEPTEVDLKVYEDVMRMCGAKAVMFSKEPAEIMAQSYPEGYSIIIGINPRI
ncbi:MAG: rod shape-determining protein [Clostridiaceae bacterium]|nr:rod shape-determining protein [Clostridiaceae bacterium]